MTTDSLLLKRIMGTALPDDYVDWAVARMCAGLDTPNLRILAGLNIDFERDEIESYFKRTCAELNIETPPQMGEPRIAARFVKRAYDLGEMSAEAAVYMMSTLYQKSGYKDSLLAIWYDIEEELSLRGSGHEGCFYPPKELDLLGGVFEREWLLFTRALQLELPPDFMGFIKCDQCEHIGASRLKHRTLLARIRAVIPWYLPKPPLWHSCTSCGAYEYHGMVDPLVREVYFKRLESEQSAAADAPHR
jgi:hypothetical protein